MKTSNKLLLAIFLGIILLTTTVQLMVYAKYKRGDYTAFHRENYNQLTKFIIPPVRFVYIIGLGNCVVSSSDSTKLEVQDYNEKEVVYNVKDDTLFIRSSHMAVTDKSNSDHISRSNNLVNLYLPAGVPVKTVYSYVNFVGGVDTLSAPSYTVEVTDRSIFDVVASGPKMTKYFNRLYIGGESSSYINLNGFAIVDSLHLQLVNSSADDHEAEISHLSVDADNHSKVTISGKNVKAIK